MRKILMFSLSLALLMPGFAAEKQKKMSARDYIETYKGLAVSAMQEYGIPASIKLAQALIESDNGNSPLAINANNHFGIKCKTTWSGNITYKDDDEQEECFRSYKNVYDSYRDHSDFLANSPRYRSLFDLDPTDYKGWARGLSYAGYATNPNYSNMLIKLIEQYRLDKLDTEVVSNSAAFANKEEEEAKPKQDTARAISPAQTVKVYEDNLPEGVVKMETRPGTVERPTSSGPIVIPAPRVISNTRAPKRKDQQQVAPVPIQTKQITASTNTTTAPNAPASQKSDIYEYTADDFAPAKSKSNVTTAPVKKAEPVVEPVTEPVAEPVEERKPKKQIEMIPEPEPVRAPGTSGTIAYGAPTDTPNGFYNGPKFDPSGMPSVGNKNGIALYRNNNRLCVIASKGQTLQSIGAALGIKPSKLAEYNEMRNEPVGITPGSIVYVAPKGTSVNNGYRTHMVIKGETLHYVSQKYGIKMEKLAKMNGMPLDYQIKPGQRLKLEPNLQIK